MLTHRRVMEIKARLAAATPRPWEIDAGYYGSKLLNQVTHTEGSFNYSVALCRNMSSKQEAADAEFIAHAPEDIALLLEVVEAAMDHPDFTYDNAHLCKQYWSDAI